MLRHVFRAMGTTVEALLEPDGAGGAAALLAVEAEFERLEGILSRFRPDSDLSRLNRAGRIEGAPDLLRVVELALRAHAETEGRFDPTVLDALVAAGYDRTFEDMAPSGPSNFVALSRLNASRSAQTVRSAAGELVALSHKATEAVRVEGTAVVLAPGVRLDLGGIGKGYAADRATELLAPFGPCLVNAGGDVAVSGVPAAGAWSVAVATPSGPLALGLTRGGLATSGSDRRRWMRDGEERHHLVDPATRRPARSRWLRVTVAATSALEAEVAAKDLYLGGDPAGHDAVLVAVDGRVERTGALA